MGMLGLHFASLIVVLSISFQAPPDPEALLREADRLSWLRAWTPAGRLYAEADKLFTVRGDERSALYARVSHLRAQLPRLSVAQVSVRLAEYLELPAMQADDRLRLRCLVIKGETDEDLDPTLAEQSWREAEALAERLGDAAWANRARGELGLVAFLQGDVGGSVTALGKALKVAQSNGDLSSQVRWLTLFGHGYVQLGRPAEALDFYDRALKVASAVPELQFPVMTYVGRAEALLRLERFDEADRLLEQALAVAVRQEARGYLAELTAQIGLIANRRGQAERSLMLLAQARNLAQQAGASRLVADIALDTARIQRSRDLSSAADRTLREGIQVARTLQERLLLPRLLSELGDLRSSQRRYAEADALLDEATDLLEGLFTSTSSPWTQSRLASGMNDVFLARIGLEGARGAASTSMFQAMEQARARSLLELLINKPVADQKPPQEYLNGEREISALQLRLLRTTERDARRRLLDQIFTAEERLAPISTELFERGRRGGPRSRVTLGDVQRVLADDEILIEFALTERASYALVVTRHSSRVQLLSARAGIRAQTESLLDRVRSGEDQEPDGTRLGGTLFGLVPELKGRKRLIISPDAELYDIPFEVLSLDGHRLLESHVVSYVPSGAVLSILRNTKTVAPPTRIALAVSASAVGDVTEATRTVTRDVYSLNASMLRPLPAADDEARSLSSIFGQAATTTLLGPAANESAFKQKSLAEFQIVHVASHGLVSTKFPARSALLLYPSEGEDGILQAREILLLRLRAQLVTLSACDTGAGSLHGQDGVASLVRPFLAAGARAVVANLWAADDTFSLALMREFYRQLAAGADVAAAMRGAKLQMLTLFGPQALARLWSGVLVYGDGSGTITRHGLTDVVKE